MAEVEYRIDQVEIRVTVGAWRGDRKLNQFTPDRFLLLFAVDDEEPLPYGRALEALLEDLRARAQATEKETQNGA